MPDEDVYYEVWLGDDMVAGADDLDTARYYASLYMEGGEPRLMKATTHREEVPL